MIYSLRLLDLLLAQVGHREAGTCPRWIPIFFIPYFCIVPSSGRNFIRLCRVRLSPPSAQCAHAKRQNTHLEPQHSQIILPHIPQIRLHRTPKRRKRDLVRRLLVTIIFIHFTLLFRARFHRLSRSLSRRHQRAGRLGGKGEIDMGARERGGR